MNTQAIIAVEEQAINLADELKKTYKQLPNPMPKEQRDYFGTLWLNLGSLLDEADKVHRRLQELGDFR